MTSPMLPDGRANAWATAWQLLQNAEKLRKHPNFPDAAANMDLYDQFLREAQLYVALTYQPVDVGLAAGKWLAAVEQEQEIERARSAETREKIEQMMAAKKAKANDG